MIESEQNGVESAPDSPEPDSPEPVSNAPSDKIYDMSQLKKSSLGKKYISHAEHVSAIIAGRQMKTAVSSIDNAVNSRRSFVHSLQLDRFERPFELPCGELPQYIIITNLSGVSEVGFSAVPEAILALLSPHVSPMKNIVELIEFVERNNFSLILTYSLPFHQRVDSAYWELRTISRVNDADGKIRDGQKTITSLNIDDAKATISTIDAEALRPSVVAIMCATFESLIKKAINLDIDSCAETREEKMRDIINGLRQERKKLLSDIDTMKKSHEKTMDNISADFGIEILALEERVTLQATDTQKNEDRLKQEYADLEEHCEISTRALKKEIQQLKDDRQNSKCDQLLSELDKDEKKKKKEKDNTLKRLDGLTKRNTELEKTKSALTRSNELLEMKLQKSVVKERQASQRASEGTKQLASLRKMVDNTSDEKEALQSELDDTKKRCRVLRAILTIAKLRYAQLENRCLKEREINTTLGLQLADLRNDSKKRIVPTTTNVSVQTEMQKELLELGTLTTENVTMRDEIATLKEKIDSTITTVLPNQFEDPEDPATTALMQQIHISLSALGGLSRKRLQFEKDAMAYQSMRRIQGNYYTNTYSSQYMQQFM